MREAKDCHGGIRLPSSHEAISLWERRLKVFCVYSRDCAGKAKGSQLTQRVEEMHPAHNWPSLLAHLLHTERKELVFFPFTGMSSWPFPSWSFTGASYQSLPNKTNSRMWVLAESQNLHLVLSSFSNNLEIRCHDPLIKRQKLNVMSRNQIKLPYDQVGSPHCDKYHDFSLYDCFFKPS